MLKSVLLDHNPIASLYSSLLEKLPLFGDFAGYLRSLLFAKDDKVLEKLLFLIGVASLTLKAVKFIRNTALYWKWLPYHLLNSKQVPSAKLRQQYGDCFVVITGFTEGIGRAFAQIFAEHGFNLLLIGRNKQKVETKVAQISNLYKNIKIEYLISNLSDFNDVSKLEEQLAKLKDLDIGIVINNAGSVDHGDYIEVKPQGLLNDIIVDLWAVVTLNRILLPKLRERKYRSAILNISSCTGVYLSAELGVYSSCKKSLDIYSRILAQQNKDKVDVLSVRPFGVATKMMRMKKGPFIITPRQCVSSIIADLVAGESTTFGHLKHKLSSTLAYEGSTEENSFKLYKKIWKAAK